VTADRDKSIERLLRRARSFNAETTNECLDAETMAALADDTLTAAARRDAEAHLADCDRCQALSAVMVRAEVATGPRHGEAARKRMLGWLVPAAAAATAVALWVLVPGQSPPGPEQPVSDRETAATGVASPLQTAPTEQPGDSIREVAPQTPADARLGDTERRRDIAVGSRISPASPGAPAVEQSLKAEESLERTARADSPAFRQEQTPAAAPAEEPTQTAASPKEQNQVTGGSQAAGPVDAPPSREARAAESSAVIASAPRNTDQGRANESTKPLAGAPAALSAQSRAAAVVEIVSPNPRVRWRIGPGSAVQRSTDGGASWAAQQTGISAALTAGSAPSPEICWFVGRGGIVLRTSDGGREWQRTPFPESADLIAITASTALDATVTLADGRRLATMDGGRTWAPTP
jgi:Photosynthesis system II assembly factor YCF48